VISAVAFCPHPPLLVPQLAGTTSRELERLRSACTAAIEPLGGAGRQLVVIGAGASSRSHATRARGSLAGYGAQLAVHLGAPGCGSGQELPLSLTIGAWLVGAALGPSTGAVGYSVGPDFATTRPAAELLARVETEDAALLVMGDGSARRGVTAPGYLDARAVPFDDAVVAALREGNATALASLDPLLGEALLAAGVPAWRAAGRLLSSRTYDAHLRYADDPYGVGYFVATWTARG
jgi:hypothetical protein